MKQGGALLYTGISLAVTIIVLSLSFQFPLIFCEYFIASLETPRECHTRVAIQKDNPKACAMAGYPQGCFNALICTYENESQCAQLEGYAYGKNNTSAADVCMKRFTEEENASLPCRPGYLHVDPHEPIRLR